MRNLLSLEAVLKWGWSLQAYMAATASASGGKVSAETHAHISLIDTAICDEYWWSCLKVINTIYDAVRQSFAWAESCPCHYGRWEWDEDDDEVAPKLKKLWRSCPMRGRRLPELACGCFHEVLRDLLDKRLATLLLSFPPSVSKSQRASLAKEFEFRRMHLVFVLTLKLAAMEEAPRMIFGIAHHDAAQSREALQRCLASSSAHVLFRRLRSQELRCDVDLYLEGAPLDSCPRLMALVGELKFGYCVERLVEGDHARTSRAFKHAPTHSEAFDSLARRMSEIKDVLATAPGFDAICDLITRMKNPKGAVRLLGLADHPALGANLHAWDPLFSKVVYRADPQSLHVTELPQMQIMQQPQQQEQVALSSSAAQSPARGDHPHESLVALVGAEVAPDVGMGGGACQAHPRMPSTLLELRKVYARKFLSLRLKAFRDEGGHRLYCLPLQAGSIKTLKQKLSLSAATPPRMHGRLWWEDIGYVAHPSNEDQEPGDGSLFAHTLGRSGLLWFSVVDPSPAASKRAQVGDLHTGDVGLAIHRPLSVCFEQRRAVIEAAPLTKTDEIFENASSLPLVLFPSALDLENLVSVRGWEVDAELWYEFACDGLPPHAAVAGRPLPHGPGGRALPGARHRRSQRRGQGVVGGLSGERPCRAGR